MSHHCNEQPATVRDLITALSAVDPDLHVYETWDEIPGWFEVEEGRSILWLGTAKCGHGDDSPDGGCRHHR